VAIELVPGMAISASGLRAERLRMEVTANNLANIHSTRDADGNAFQRRLVIYSAVLDRAPGRGGPGQELGGVRVADIVKDPRPPVEIHAPYHPDADENGMLKSPNISPIEEMLDMMTAARAYEANLSAMKESRRMAEQTITMGK